MLPSPDDPRHETQEAAMAKADPDILAFVAAVMCAMMFLV